MPNYTPCGQIVHRWAYGLDRETIKVIIESHMLRINNVHILKMMVSLTWSS